MTIQGTGTRETVDVDTLVRDALAPRGGFAARLMVTDSDGDTAVIRLSSNSLRVLAKLAEAAADELDCRSIGG